MNLLDWFRRRPSAPVARERLQVLLAHERAVLGNSDLIGTLREEILAVIAKHIAINDDSVRIKLERGDQVSLLEIDIELPAVTKSAA
jgi:cell division topological specificity factor